MFEETTDGTLLMLSKVSAISTVKQDEETGRFCFTITCDGKDYLQVYVISDFAVSARRAWVCKLGTL